MNTVDDYYNNLLMGAPLWAIEQVKEEVLKLQDRNEDLMYLKVLVGLLIDMLETVETSDNETDFHPTVIRSCRVQHTEKLKEIMPKIAEIVKK